MKNLPLFVIASALFRLSAAVLVPSSPWQGSGCAQIDMAVADNPVSTIGYMQAAREAMKSVLLQAELTACAEWTTSR
jgi:hypothetical protein